MVGGITGVLGYGLAVAGFASIGYLIAAPEPGHRRLQRPGRRTGTPAADEAHGASRGKLPGSPLRRCATSIAVGIALAALTAWPAMLVIGAAGTWFLPRLLTSDGGAAAQIAKIEAIATFAEMLRDTLSAAAGLGHAIAAAAGCAAAPISTEAKQLAVMVQDRTVPLERALRIFADQLADPAADEIVIALMFAARNSASDLASLLSDLAGHIRAEAAMSRRVLVAGARTHTAVRLITAVTLGMGVVLFTCGGHLMAPYATLLGQCVLLLVSGLFAAGYLWLMRLSRPNIPPRLLRGADASAQTAARVPAQMRVASDQPLLGPAVTDAGL